MQRCGSNVKVVRRSCAFSFASICISSAGGGSEMLKANLKGADPHITKSGWHFNWERTYSVLRMR